MRVRLNKYERAGANRRNTKKKAPQTDLRGIVTFGVNEYKCTVAVESSSIWKV